MVLSPSVGIVVATGALNYPTPQSRGGTMSSTRGREAAKAAAWIAAGALGATALTGIAFAATDSPTATPTPQATQSPNATTPPNGDDAPDMGMRGGPGGHHGFGPGGPGRGLGAVLHGDVTVEGEDGNAKLVRMQKGTVESIGDGTLTVKSSDGYTSTWTVNDDTTIRRDRDEAALADLKVGDTVIARGPLSGDTATARMVQALSPEAAAEMTERIEEFKERRAERQGDAGTDASTQGSNSSSSASLDISVI
jgi:hypothetical protein